MTALYIIAGILLVVILLLLLPVTLRARLLGEEFRLVLKIGFLRFTLIPEKEKKVNYKKVAKELRGKNLSEYRESPKQKKKKKEKSSAVSDFMKELKGDFKDRGFFTALRELVSYLSVLLKKRLHIRVTSLHIKVGTGSPAVTAVTCGIVSQSVAYLLETLECKASLVPIKDGAVSVTPDFLNEAFSGEIDCELFTRVCDLGVVGIKTITLIVKYKIRNENKDTRKEEVK